MQGKAEIPLLRPQRCLDQQLAARRVELDLQFDRPFGSGYRAGKDDGSKRDQDRRTPAP